MLREIIGEFVISYGYRVVLAATDEEAVAAVARHSVSDLMLIDYLLADGTDIQAYDRLTVEAGRAVPATLLTGMSDDSLIAETSSHGVTLLRKPVKMEQHFEIIEDMLPEG